MNKLGAVVFSLVLMGILFFSTIFMVDQRQFAIVFGLGEIKTIIKEPGLYFKLPAPLQNVVFLDKRLLTIDSLEANRFITAEKKNILVDSFVKWHITDPKLYYISFGGDEQRAKDRLNQIIKAALNDEITKRSVRDVISGERGKVMEALRHKVSIEARQIGVDIVDVRLKHVDYVEQINQSVYDRMRAERTRVANELRSTGYAEAEQIRADADKQSVVILAQAYREAEKLRGQGDAEESKIYAQAFGRNPEAYRFFRSLEAYRASFKNKQDVLVVDPSADFFRYFKSSSVTK